MTPKQLYFDAHLFNFKKQYPSAYSSGHYTKPKYPKVETANGLTKYIIDILNWFGHHGESTKNMGTPRKKSHERMDIFTGETYEVVTGIEWTKGAGTTGTTDVKGHFKSVNHKFPIPIYIEIKIKKDTKKDAQIKYEKKVTSTGALHCYCKTPDDFVTFYLYLCKQ